ncbi:MAG: pitrilysin family protein [Planctomycetota bacterium]
MNRFRISILLISAAALLAGCDGAPDSRAGFRPPRNWRELSLPVRTDFAPMPCEKHTLPNGIVVFLAEDHELPLVSVKIAFRGGSVHEPAGKTGLADILTETLRSGGTGTLPAERFDEALEDIAANLAIGVELDRTTVSFSVLKEDVGRGFELLTDLLRNPALPPEKMKLALDRARSKIARRNDNTGEIASREFRKLLYGADSPWAATSEYASLDRITREDLADFHRLVFQPRGMIVGAWGDFNAADMKKRIEAAFESWKGDGRELPAVARPVATTPMSVHLARKENVNQTQIMLGRFLELRRNSPDYAAVILVNEILSGSFGSRLFNEVRTKRGLAYTVGGAIIAPYEDRPAVFRAACQTRSDATVEAIGVIRDEIRKLKTAGATADELRQARDSVLNTFVFEAATKDDIVSRRMHYEFYGYPPDFANRVFTRIATLSLAEVNAAAARYLDGDNVVILAVGDDKAFGKPLSALGDVRDVDIIIPSPAPPQTGP